MAEFATKTYEQIREEIASRFRTLSNNRLTPADARSGAGILASVIAGAILEQQLLLPQACRDGIPSTSSGASLDAHGLTVGITRTPSTFAQGRVSLSGTTGTTIPANTQIQSATGVIFATSAAAVIGSSGVVEVGVVALVAGEAANLIAADNTLALSSAVSGVSGVSFVGDFSGGAQEESDEEFRPRVLERFRKPVSGGSQSDWIGWTRALPDVVNARVEEQSGLVTVYALFSRASRPPYGIPTDDDIAAVTASLNANRPYGTRLAVEKPVAITIDIAVSGITNTVTQARMRSALTNLFETSPSIGGSFTRARIFNALLAVAGGEDFDVTSPTGNTDLGVSGVAALGTVTFP